MQDSSGDLGTLLGVRGYEQLVKEELVGQAADLRAAQPVNLVAAADERQGTVQGALDMGVDHVRSGEGLLGTLQFVGDAVVFIASEVPRYGAGDDTTGESLAFLGQFPHAALGPGDLGLSLSLLVVQLSLQADPDLILHNLRQSDGGVIALNGSLNVGSRQVGLETVRTSLLAAKAEEVEVAALGVGQA